MAGFFAVSTLATNATGLLLTREALYLRDRSRRCFRLDLSALRQETRTDDGSSQFTFGRRDQVFVPFVAECKLVAGLRSALESPTRFQGVEPPPPEGKLDLNQANAKQLQGLPFIGPKLSYALIRLREQRGGFSRLEELMTIPGLGPRQFEVLRALVYVDPSKSTHNTPSFAERSTHPHRS